MKGTKGITLIALIITIIVLLILAVAAISAVKDSSIITHAKKAASETEMAQIREKAELIKTEMFLASKMDKNIVISKQEYINRLLLEFPGSERKADKVIVDGLYDIKIKKSDSDIFKVEVKEHSDIINAKELMQLSYTITPLVEKDDKTFSVNIKFN